MFHYRDQITLVCASGDGGFGAVSFHRTEKNPRGGPDGGDGGSGGNVVFSAQEGVRGFDHLKKTRRFKAEGGRPGRSRNQTGAKGENLKIRVPPGTVLRDESGLILADLERSKSFVLLKGGKGGRGNAFFKSSRRRAPEFAQNGRPAQEKQITLEFKPLIKAGLIGAVNTGKSTFFNSITGGKSPAASRPYTTLIPYYGRIKTLNSEAILMDIPGISVGAAESAEKGLSFLRSLQRAVLLIHFIDGAQNEALKAQRDLDRELKAFDKKYPDKLFSPLSEKKRLTVLTKTDLLNRRLANKRPPEIPSPFLRLSNKTGEGVRELLKAIEKRLS